LPLILPAANFTARLQAFALYIISQKQKNDRSKTLLSNY